MNLRLDVTNTRQGGPGGRRAFDFDGGPVAVGRSAHAQVVIEGDTISRTHFTLDLLGGVWHVTHQGSLIPTTLNGAPLPQGQPRRVNDGDVLTVGDHSILVSVGRGTFMPELEPMGDSVADMTMSRSAFAAQGQGAGLPDAGAAPGPAGRPVPSLILQGGTGDKLELREVERAYVIGRAAGCDLSVSDGSVSRRHALVRFDGTRIYVRDAGARNPLRVNGRPIFGETPLAHGDMLGIGQIELRVVTEHESSPPPHATPAAGLGAQTQVLSAVKEPPPWPPAGDVPPAHSPAPFGEPAPWDQVAQPPAAPDWAAAAAAAPPPAPAPLPPPPPHVPEPPAAAPDWSAMAGQAQARQAPPPRPSWDVPAPAAAPPPPPAWDTPAAPAAPSWGAPLPPPVAPPPPAPPPMPPPTPPPMAVAPPPAIPEAPAPAPSPPRGPQPASPARPAGKVVARRASSHRGWLIVGVTSMVVALTAGIVLLVAAFSG